MKLRPLLLLAALLTALAAFARTHNDTVTVMTLNLHAGHDASLAQIGLLIRQYRPDFVALQEVDRNTRRANVRHQNGRDFITELAYHTGMQGYFGHAIDFSGGQYGIGLLSRHTLVDLRNIHLPHPNPRMEQRTLLEGTFALPCGDTIIAASTHLEAFDSLSRVEQARFIQNHFAGVAHPVVLAGDFNAPPGDPAIQQLAAQWRDCTGTEPTFSTGTPQLKIDYILARPSAAWQVVRSEVIPVVISDHFPVIATIVVTH